MSRNDNGDGGSYYTTHTVGRRRRKIKLRDGQVEPRAARTARGDVCGLIKYRGAVVVVVS